MDGLDNSVAYIFVIIFVVLALNIYFLTSRMRRDNSKRKRITRAAADEAKQALWRDKEIARRIAREQEDALERVLLKNETLALYEEVRRRHAKEDEMERLGLSFNKSNEEPMSADIKLRANDAYTEEIEHISLEPQVEVRAVEESEEEPEEEPLHISWGSHFLIDDDKDKDPFDIFKRKKK